ncbi:ABC-2 type transport system permease protein [Kineosphaera limosa]|uniref:ABC transporter permease protein n=1 Tax=Kineosphaera limosa NBRC 100340 TaxID=1184609 RepID=K6W6I1_9MICO|nr:hypothetical protein [Kineosphaera limosa]NYD98890.1 ABC-2 type transport system permease protein [Kineosphaera limosa]GAB94785.1 hypothetical protein KILIM_011_00580 [Kineosphaera limosa NBRC 100340]
MSAGGPVDALRAEWAKVATLPMAPLTVAVMTAAGVLLGWVIAAGARQRGLAVTGGDVLVASAPYLATGIVLLGTLPAAQEYAGRQIRTTLLAMPDRRALLAAKTLAALGWVGGTSALCGATALLAANLALRANGAAPLWEGDGRRLLGVIGYLALIGMLAHALCALVRHLIPALAGMLGLLLIASPLISAATEHARWLPDRAAAALYLSGDTMLSARAGSLVAIAWIAVLLGCAYLRQGHTDP